MTVNTGSLIGMLRSPHFWRGFRKGTLEALVYLAIFDFGVLVGFLWRANI